MTQAVRPDFSSFFSFIAVPRRFHMEAGKCIAARVFLTVPTQVSVSGTLSSCVLVVFSPFYLGPAGPDKEVAAPVKPPVLRFIPSLRPKPNGCPFSLYHTTPFFPFPPVLFV